MAQLLISVSAAALLDRPFRARLEALCRRHRPRVYLPTGALGGLDALGAATAGGLTHVAVRVVQPGEPAVLFSGEARAGVAQFPDRLNVAALTALVAKQPVELELAQAPDRRELGLSARGAFGEFTFALTPTLQPDRLSHIVALSVLASLRSLRQPIRSA